MLKNEQPRDYNLIDKTYSVLLYNVRFHDHIISFQGDILKIHLSIRGVLVDNRHRQAQLYLRDQFFFGFLTSRFGRFFPLAIRTILSSKVKRYLVRMMLNFHDSTKISFCLCVQYTIGLPLDRNIRDISVCWPGFLLKTRETMTSFACVYTRCNLSETVSQELLL